MIWPTCPRTGKIRVDRISVTQWSPCNRNAPAMLSDPVFCLASMQPAAWWRVPARNSRR